MNATSAQSGSLKVPRYYQATDRVGAALFIWLPVIGGISAAVLGTVYAFIEYLVGQIMEMPYWMAIITPIFTLGLVFTARWICRLGKVRRLRLHLPIALIVGAMGFYAAWHTYVNFAVNTEIFDPMLKWWMSPLQLLRGIWELAEYRGLSSWFWWLLEAVSVFWLIVTFMKDYDPEIPFCEQCGQWTKENFSLTRDDIGIEAAAEKFRHGNADGLEKLGPPKYACDSYAQIRVLQCPCLAGRFACVERRRVKAGTKSGFRYNVIANHWYYDLGSGKSSDAAPIITNMEIDEEMQHKLSAIETNLLKGK